MVAIVKQKQDISIHIFRAFVARLMLTPLLSVGVNVRSELLSRLVARPSPPSCFLALEDLNCGSCILTCSSLPYTPKSTQQLLPLDD